MKSWYQEGLDYGLPSYFIEGKYSIFYKGFKLTSCGEVWDIRIDDFYSDISKEVREFLSHKGFIQGADLLSYKRNIKRVNKFLKKLEKLFTDKEKLQEGTQDYVNCQENIYKYKDLFEFYKVKVKQHEQKYNIN